MHLLLCQACTRCFPCSLTILLPNGQKLCFKGQKRNISLTFITAMLENQNNSELGNCQNVVPECIATVDRHSEITLHSLNNSTVRASQHAGLFPGEQWSGKPHTTSDSWGSPVLPLPQVAVLNRDRRDSIRTGISLTPALEQAPREGCSGKLRILTRYSQSALLLPHLRFATPSS